MIKSSYIECFSERALYLSWKRVLASVGSDAKDFFGISIFTEKPKFHLEKLSKLIISNEYLPRRPFKYFAPKKTGTQRTKTVLKIEDAIVYQAIGNHIAEITYDDLNKTRNCVFGSVLNADVKKGVKLLEEDPEDYYFF